VSWYFQYQRAEDIIAEHQRIAEKIRLTRLAAESDGSFAQAQGRSPIRRVIGGTVLAVGRVTTRVGQAMTRVGRALDDPEASPTI
jgi:hypothetical protein